MTSKNQTPTNEKSKLEADETVQGDVNQLEETLSHPPQPDVNFPSIVADETRAEFPEEYQIETPSGLVPAQTVRSFRESQHPHSPRSNKKDALNNASSDTTNTSKSNNSISHERSHSLVSHSSRSSSTGSYSSSSISSDESPRALSAAETRADQNLERVLSQPPSRQDINFPSITSAAEEAEFPEEYHIETPTGLVPSETIRSLRANNLAQIETGRSIRSINRQRTRQSRLSGTAAPDLEKGDDDEPPYQFVTFKVGDPENPINWPSWYRWTICGIVSILVVCVAFGSSEISGALGTVMDKYHVSLEVATLTCSIMVMGFMMGPLIWSPLSEQIGRRPVYIISLGLYTIFNIPCALAPNIGGLLVCRFLCGVFSASGLVIAGGSIADTFPQEDRGMAIAFFAAAPYGGPVLGPIVGGWIEVCTHRMDLVFWVNMAFAGALFIATAIIPETYAPVILKRRAKRLRKETGNPYIVTEQEVLKVPFTEMVKSIFLKPFVLMLTEPILDLMCFYVVLIYSLLYGFFFAYPVIFTELYNYNDGIIGLMFIPIIIGALIALGTTPFLEMQYHKICHRREPTPEDRLVGAMIGAPFIPISLFILGATSEKHVIWVGPASAGLAFGYGMVLIYSGINNYIIDSYTAVTASALAAKVFMRSAGGAAFPLFTTQMYHRLGLHWASWLLAFISLAMVLIPFVFYKYGAQIRAKASARKEAKLQAKAEKAASDEKA